MTLIARMLFGAAPLYIGDAMLSNTSRPPAKPISLPAYENINQVLPDDAWGYVSGLRQKINILNGGDLVVAWAGSEFQARLALRELAQAARDGATAVDDFFAALDTMETNELDQLTLLGTKITPQSGRSLVANFAVNCPFQESILGVGCRVSGTGTNRFSTELPHLLNDAAIGTTDHQLLERAWKTAMLVSGLLIGKETYRGENIVEMWGGAFEAAYIANDRIEKIGNTLHSVWWLEPLNERQAGLRMWLKLLKYDYVGDHLVVNVVQFNDDRASGSTSIISPLLRTGDAPDVGAPNFEYETLLCHVTLPPTPSGDIQTFTLAKFRPTTAFVVVHRELEHTRIQISSSLFEEIRTAIQPRCEYEVVL